MYQFLTVALSILTVASMLGTASAIFYASRSTSIKALLKEENEALTAGYTRLEKENEVLKAKYDAAVKEAAIWKDNVTQAPSIKELTAVMASQNKDVINSLGNVASELASLTKAMKKGSHI